jgi:hypothetical protein
VTLTKRLQPVIPRDQRAFTYNTVTHALGSNPSGLNTTNELNATSRMKDTYGADRISSSVKLNRRLNFAVISCVDKIGASSWMWVVSLSPPTSHRHLNRRLVDHTVIICAVTKRRNLTVKMGIEHQQSNLRSDILLTVLLGVRSETHEINTGPPRSHTV